jgi:2-C-methyl-D-erythritol 4-phosphate cytidylyltransferase
MIKFECLKNEQLLERYKLVKIKIVKGSCDNIKITTPEDVR